MRSERPMIPPPQQRISAKGSVKRIIQSEVAARTGRPMTNKAAKKWLKRQTHGGEQRHGFQWPQVQEFPRRLMGMASWLRFPTLRPIPFGWVAAPFETQEKLIMPAWLYGLLYAKEWTVGNTRLRLRQLGMFLMGVKR